MPMACEDDGDCVEPTPVCDTSIGRCVGCLPDCTGRGVRRRWLPRLLRPVPGRRGVQRARAVRDLRPRLHGQGLRRRWLRRIVRPVRDRRGVRPGRRLRGLHARVRRPGVRTGPGVRSELRDL
ncbi:MAG: hypothetical protein MZW92_06200 [Comamonadaceae bacterium]|nr:hypothetical protein [Comamonadaceae bacterium]